MIPEPILRYHQINCLVLDEHTKQQFKDTLCLFREVAVHLHVTATSKFFIGFLGILVCDPKLFCGASREKTIFIYIIDIEDEDFVGKLARRIFGKHENTVKPFRYNNHKIYINNIDSFFDCFRCLTCDRFFHRADHFNGHLLCCEDRVKNFYS